MTLKNNLRGGRILLLPLSVGGQIKNCVLAIRWNVFELGDIEKSVKISLLT